MCSADDLLYTSPDSKIKFCHSDSSFLHIGAAYHDDKFWSFKFDFDGFSLLYHTICGKQRWKQNLKPILKLVNGHMNFWMSDNYSSGQNSQFSGRYLYAIDDNGVIDDDVDTFQCEFDLDRRDILYLYKMLPIYNEFGREVKNPFIWGHRNKSLKYIYPNSFEYDRLIFISGIPFSVIRGFR